MCCARGKHVLDATDNPPISPEEEVLLRNPAMAVSSRVINAALAFAASGTTPTREDGGHGVGRPLNDGMPCVLYLHGRIHHRWFPPSHDGPARRHALGDASLVLDRATTLDRRGKDLLLRYREYLQERHPLAHVLAHASEYAREHGGEPVAISVAPSTAASAEMEVALVYADNSEDPQGPPARYAVLLPLSAPEGARHLANFVSYFSSLYDTTMYPVLHPGGDGGFTMAAIPSRVDRTPGLAAAAASCSNYAEDFPRGSGRRHRFTLLEWVKALLYQSQRLHLTGRLMQEWSEFGLGGGALSVAST